MKTVLICFVVTGLVLACWQYGHGSAQATAATDPAPMAVPWSSADQAGDAYQPNLRGSDSSSHANSLSTQ